MPTVVRDSTAATGRAKKRYGNPPKIKSSKASVANEGVDSVGDPNPIKDKMSSGDMDKGKTDPGPQEDEIAGTTDTLGRHKAERDEMKKRHDKESQQLHLRHSNEYSSMYDRQVTELSGAGAPKK